MENAKKDISLKFIPVMLNRIMFYRRHLVSSLSLKLIADKRFQTKTRDKNINISKVAKSDDVSVSVSGVRRS